MEKERQIEEQYLSETLELVQLKLNKLHDDSSRLEGIFDESNEEYLEYLKSNANKMNEDDFVEIINMQGRLDDLQATSEDAVKLKNTYNKMLDKPYFSSIVLKEHQAKDLEKYYIGINSLVDDNKNFKVVDWRSPIASIFYDYEQGDCAIKTNSSILHCDLLNKRQYGISGGKLNYFFDSTINIEDEILQAALAQNASNKMKSIIQTIQKEQNQIIRGDENKNLIVQGVAGSGKTAIALHRIAYLLYKMAGKIRSNNIVFISPNNAFSSYISSVLPDLAEDDIQKLQLDLIARKYLKKHLILERKYEQVERILTSKNLNIQELNYKLSSQFLADLLSFATTNYIDNFDINEFVVNGIDIDVDRVKKLFFDRYSDRDLFTRFKWITDNIYDIYFYKYKKPETIVKLKELIFTKLYALVANKNCVKAYMNFLESKGMKLELVDNKVKNEDAYAILFFKIFIYGCDKFTEVKHLVVDEAQDYSPLQMYILEQFFACPKTILGDYNQSIDVEKSRNNLMSLEHILPGDLQLVKLNKTYRTTIEIAEFFNSISKTQKVDVVSRHGDKVELIEVNAKTKSKTLLQLIENYRNLGYNSIGIVTKNNQIAKKVFAEISNLDEGINLIDDNIDNYDNKTCVISAYNSKGLEFDAVIIIDEGYGNTETDKNIFYISATRALHKLSVVSLEKCNEFIKNFKESL